MRKPVAEITADQFEARVYSLAMPTNTARGVYCGCLVEHSVVQGGQLFAKVMEFRRAGVDVRVYPYTPDLWVEYLGNEVSAFDGPPPPPDFGAPEPPKKAKKK